MSSVKPIPDGYHTVTPYLSVKGGAAALAFYQQAFGATVLYRLDMPDGTLGHAEIQIGDCRLMLADEMPPMPDTVIESPRTRGGSTVALHLYVPNVDEQFARAVAAGATVRRPVTNQFYGDRTGTIEDPFGHIWSLATHVEEVSPEELQRRVAAMPVANPG